MEEKVLKSISLAERCSKYIDLLSGTEKERDFIIKILQEIDNPLLTYHLHPVSVIYFEEKYTYIEVDGREYTAFAMPYTYRSSVEGRLVDNLDELNEGDILIHKIPEDVDDAKFILLKAYERGCLGVIFYDRVNSPRRIVVSLEEKYTYNTGKFIEIPVVSIPYRSGIELLKKVGKRVRIECDVDYRDSIGYNLEIILSEDDRNILVSAHFDHWFTGFLDNCLGVGVALSILDDLFKVCEKFGVRVVLFTAEEFGIPNIASLYWAWGSRSFLQYLTSSKLLETLRFILNIDVVGRRPCVYTTRDIYESLNLNVEFVQSAPYFDTLNFEPVGIPCITISCLKDCWDIYHTPLEDFNNISIRYLKNTIEIVESILRKLYENNLEIDYSIYISRCRRYLEEIGIHIQSQYRDFEVYRNVRSVLSRNMLIKSVREYEITFSENILETLKKLSEDGSIIEVSELGTGLTLLRRPCKTSYMRFLNYFKDVVRYSIRR